ncbi:MAG: hypothetical protein P4M07_16295 [Xanthobacteraceae bacterium]|nr:hypothetical protein [Xanthobacteraceae bacterium]
MPRYFFHTRIGDQLLEDPDGIELRDPDQAWDTARRTIRGLIAGGAPQAQLLTAVLEVVDADGEIVLEFPFSEALIETPPGAPGRPPPR